MPIYSDGDNQLGDALTDKHITVGTVFHTGSYILSGSDTPNYTLGLAGSVSLNNNVYILANGRVGINTDSPNYKLQIAGNMGINEYIYHNGDADTYIRYVNNGMTFKAGNLSFINLDKKSSSPHELTFNDDSDNIDFIVKGNGSNEGNPLFKCDASTGRVGINGVDSPECELHIAGAFKHDNTTKYGVTHNQMVKTGLSTGNASATVDTTLNLPTNSWIDYIYIKPTAAVTGMGVLYVANILLNANAGAGDVEMLGEDFGMTVSPLNTLSGSLITPRENLPYAIMNGIDPVDIKLKIVLSGMTPNAGTIDVVVGYRTFDTS